MKTRLFCLAGLLLAVNLQATWVSFPDRVATSDNGRFRIEARSPGNAPGASPLGRQSNFRYRLLEGPQRREVWSRQQPMDEQFQREGPPMAVHVSDDGWVIIRTAEFYGLRTNGPCELVVVDRQGRDRLRVDFLKALLPDRSDYYECVVQSSAGLRWGEACCHSYFIALNGTTHFSFTAWWGKRLVLDLAAGHAVTVTPRMESKLRTLERAFVLQTLKATSLWKFNLEEAINPGLAKDSPGPTVWEVFQAMVMAANLNLIEAAPLLRTLEASPIVYSTVGGYTTYEAPPGGTKPKSFQNLTVRQMAQHCLRRLGQPPSRHQTTRLYGPEGYWHSEDPLPFRREHRVYQLKAGMSPEEVLDLLGAPDFIENAWEYDLELEVPVTLEIGWDEEGSTLPKKTIPPKWSQGFRRVSRIVR